MTSPTPEENNAYTLLVQMLEEWGLGSLASEALRFLQEGYTQAEIPVLLQDTEPYKKRFAGNQARRQKGLAVLSPREYLEAERSYRQVMMNAGLPEGFYDTPEDFAGFLGNDVSPVEIQRRVDEAVDAAYKADDNTKAVWASMGLNPADMVPWVLDQERGRDELNRIIRGGRIAGAAKGYGVDLSQEQAERFGVMASDQYVKESQEFARLAGVGSKLSGFYSGQDYGAEDAADELFGSSTEAERKRKLLMGREEGEFAARGGAGTKALGSGPGGY